jgi:hypothetical protein
MLAVVEAARIPVDADVDDADVVCSPPALPAADAGSHFGNGAGAGQARHQLMQIESLHALATNAHRVEFEFGYEIRERQHTG